MQFYLRYPTGSLTFTAGNDTNADANDTETWYCTKLTQGEGFWNNSYIWTTSTDANRNAVERRISNFNADQDGLYLEYPCDTDEIPTTDDTFELFDIWPPTQIHEAINDSIRDSWMEFPEILVDETLVIEEDKKAYDLSGLSRTPASVLQLYAERSQSRRQGVISTVTDSDNFGDTSMDLSDVTSTTWRASIYSGTGKGQLFTISAVSTTTQIFTVETSATTNPDTTSKVVIWDSGDEELNWYRIHAARFDRPDYPNTMYIQGEPSASWGLRYRMVYVPQPIELDEDTDATAVPRYFILHKALSILHDSLVEDNRADSRRHMEIAENHDQLARDYALRHPRKYPSFTLWSEGEVHGGYGMDPNPLGW
jgi:hypothetical protein